MRVFIFLFIITLGIIVFKKFKNSKKYNLYLSIIIAIMMIIFFFIIVAIFKYLVIFLLIGVGIYLYKRFYRKQKDDIRFDE